MLAAEPNDQPTLRGHPRIALHVSIELFPGAMLSAFILHENPPLLVAQIRVCHDPAVLIRDRQLRGHGRKIVTVQPVPNNALRCGLGPCIEPRKAVAGPSYATSTGGCHDSTREGISIGQTKPKSGVPHCNQFSRGEVLG